MEDPKMQNIPGSPADHLDKLFESGKLVPGQMLPRVDADFSKSEKVFTMCDFHRSEVAIIGAGAHPPFPNTGRIHVGRNTPVQAYWARQEAMAIWGSMAWEREYTSVLKERLHLKIQTGVMSQEEATTLFQINEGTRFDGYGGLIENG